MQVRFFSPGKDYLIHKEEIDKEMQRVLEAGDLILRDDVRKFEENLAQLVGTKYAVGLNSGTDALFLSLKLAGIKSGDEVITVGHTFHATVEAIVHCGAKPVLVDVGEDSLMDMDEVKKAITARTEAVIPVHLMGDTCDMEKLKSFWKGIIIEDACQALGAVKPVGLTQCWSFYPAKILGAYGDAGAITTDDQGLADEMRDLRQHYKYNPGKYGFNSRLDNLQAAILNVKIKYINHFLAVRKECALLYDKELKDLPIQLPKKREIYQDYIIRVEKRDELAQFLENNGIETMKNDYHFPNDLPKPIDTVTLEKHTLRLPCNPTLEAKEIKYVADKIREFYKGTN